MYIFMLTQQDITTHLSTNYSTKQANTSHTAINWQNQASNSSSKAYICAH